MVKPDLASFRSFSKIKKVEVSRFPEKNPKPKFRNI
jgi:hypothetical protein